MQRDRHTARALDVMGSTLSSQTIDLRTCARLQTTLALYPSATGLRRRRGGMN